MSGFSKQYPSVRANDDVSLSIAPGEIHAVLGENGADTFARLMIGHALPRYERWLHRSVETRLEVRSLTVPSEEPFSAGRCFSK